MRTLCCPARLPPSASSRFPGGLRRSSSLIAASIILNFRRATETISEGKPFGACPWNIAAARLSRKLSITRCYVWHNGRYVKRNTLLSRRPLHVHDEERLVRRRRPLQLAPCEIK